MAPSLISLVSVVHPVETDKTDETDETGDRGPPEEQAGHDEGEGRRVPEIRGQAERAAAMTPELWRQGARGSQGWSWRG